jgi:ABC-type lipoprotein export system ATPase subunit
VLVLRDVTKTYRHGDGIVPALAGVSLELEPGAFVSLCGTSGCGKTTLLLTAGALLRPDAGQVTVGGEDPYALAADARAGFRARSIGYVFQQFHLIPYLTVLENVRACELAAPVADGEGRAIELIERFGLADRMGHRPGELSTGERQRAALARAVLNRPKLILADEPTGNLDAQNADTILDCLAALCAEKTTVLLATHDERTAARAQRVLHMEKGRL